MTQDVRINMWTSGGQHVNQIATCVISTNSCQRSLPTHVFGWYWTSNNFPAFFPDFRCQYGPMKLLCMTWRRLQQRHRQKLSRHCLLKLRHFNKGWREPS
jgi:hypothetical protein